MSTFIEITEYQPIILKILGYLPPKSAQALRFACKAFNVKYANNTQNWNAAGRLYIQQYFPYLEALHPEEFKNKPWSLFIKVYKARLENEVYNNHKLIEEMWLEALKGNLDAIRNNTLCRDNNASPYAIDYASRIYFILAAANRVSCLKEIENEKWFSPEEGRRIFYCAGVLGNTKVIEHMLANKEILSRLNGAEFYKIFESAALSGHLSLIKLLLPIIKDTSCEPRILEGTFVSAFWDNRAEVVNFLLSNQLCINNIKSVFHRVLFMARVTGQTDDLKSLWSKFDDSVKGDFVQNQILGEAITIAEDDGNSEVVKILSAFKRDYHASLTLGKIHDANNNNNNIHAPLSTVNTESLILSSNTPLQPLSNQPFEKSYEDDEETVLDGKRALDESEKTEQAESEQLQPKRKKHKRLYSFKN